MYYVLNHADMRFMQGTVATVPYKIHYNRKNRRVFCRERFITVPGFWPGYTVQRHGTSKPVPTENTGRVLLIYSQKAARFMQGTVATVPYKKQ